MSDQPITQNDNTDLDIRQICRLGPNLALRLPMLPQERSESQS